MTVWELFLVGFFLFAFLHFKLQEDMRIISENIPLDRKNRRKFFQSISNLEQNYFEPNVYYTFEFFQKFLNLETFRFCVLGMEANLLDYIKENPMLIMAKDVENNEYLWNFKMFHK